MAKKKPTTDVSVTAFEVPQAVTGKPTDQYHYETTAGKSAKKKNPAAVALGRLGGLKGGNARAAKLSAKQKVAIAKNAAIARWGNRK